MYGKNTLKKGGNILVCNHYSAWDIPVVAMSFRRKLNFVGKKELFKKPFFRGFFRLLGASGIKREKVDLSDMKIIVSKLNNDKTIMLFPEGTRNKAEMAENLNNIKNGAAMFALLSGKPITPMILLNRPRPFKRNKLFIGESISMEHLSIKKDRDAVNKAGELLKSAMENLLATARAQSQIKDNRS